MIEHTSLPWLLPEICGLKTIQYLANHFKLHNKIPSGNLT